MKLKYSNIIDFFLLRKEIYSNLTDKSVWLYIGIVFVGIRDVVFDLLGTSVNNPTFRSKFYIDIRVLAILAVTVIIIGLLDVLSFSYPIFDIIKHFKRNKDNTSALTLGAAYSSFLTKVIKVYILANIVITPIDILSYFTSSMSVSHESVILLYITSVLAIIAYFWFNGVITRGLCIIFKVPNSARGLVFVLVFFWNALLSSAIGYLLDQVVKKLFL